MNYIIAVFRSRSSTLFFANLLKSNNIPVAIINTPNQIQKTCGISVKFLKEYFSLAQQLLMRANLSQFDGFFAFVHRKGIVSVIRL